MQRISADLIHTNNGPPLENHCVVVDENGLVRDVVPVENATVDRHLSGTLIPGFINAHCHLELSHTKGKITPGNGLVDFALELFANRAAPQEEIQQAIEDANKTMWDNGIAAVGDITNGVDTIDVKRNSKIVYHTFAEALGFREADADKAFEKAETVYAKHRHAGLASSIAPHAPYSMSRKLLERLVSWYEKHESVSTLHFLESVSEIEFCTYGTGEVNRIVDFLNYPRGEFVPYGETGPAGVLHYLNDVRQLLLVHNTYANGNDLGVMMSLFRDKVWLCTCPKANLYIENELPDYALWREHTNRICIGTDSLASNDGLSIWDEMKTIHRAQPDIPFAEMLRWATINGAKALQLDETIGSIAVSKTPGLIWLEHSTHQGLWDVEAPVRVA